MGNGVDGIGVRPRLRFWISPTISLDAAPGIVLDVGSGSADIGLSAAVALNLTNYAALTAHVVALPPYYPEDGDRARLSIFAGGRLGSVPGAVVIVVSPVILLIAFLLASGG